MGERTVKLATTITKLICIKRGHGKGQTFEIKVLLSCWDLLKKRFYLSIFREGVGERDINVELTSCMRPTCNPGMCSDKELNQWPFSLQDNALPTKPHQSGLLPRYFFQHLFRLENLPLHYAKWNKPDTKGQTMTSSHVIPITWGKKE